VRVYNERGTDLGSACISIDASGGIERELGTKELDVWMGHQLNLAMLTVAAVFPAALNKLVRTGAKVGASNYRETVEIVSDDDGTTVKVCLELKLKLNLTRKQKAGIAGPIFAAVREHVVLHLDDKSKAATLREKWITDLAEEFGDIVLVEPMVRYDIPKYSSRLRKYIAGLPTYKSVMYPPMGFPDRSNLYNENWADLFDQMYRQD
jgi:hypothetical protein